MKINIKTILLLTVLICSCCAGNAYARTDISLSFDRAPPYWPGEQITVTANTFPVSPGAYILIFGTASFIASGYTDADGKYTGVITMPLNVYESAQHPPYGKPTNTIVICATGNTNGEPIDFELGNMDMYSIDYYVPIVPSNPNAQIPEFPSVVIPVVAVLGLVAVIGRREV